MLAGFHLDFNDWRLFIEFVFFLFRLNSILKLINFLSFWFELTGFEFLFFELISTWNFLFLGLKQIKKLQKK